MQSARKISMPTKKLYFHTFYQCWPKRKKYCWNGKMNHIFQHFKKRLQILPKLKWKNRFPLENIPFGNVGDQRRFWKWKIDRGRFYIATLILYSELYTRHIVLFELLRRFIFSILYGPYNMKNSELTPLEILIYNFAPVLGIFRANVIKIGNSYLDNVGSKDP